MAGTGIILLLEKMKSEDKDYRYMATNDLLGQLNRAEFHMDERLERKVAKALMTLFTDKNGEVQNLAVKCLPPLVAKVSDELVLEVVNVLVGNMITGEEEQLRDVSSLGLKSVISELSPSTEGGKRARAALTDKLITAVSSAKDAVLLDVLETIAEILNTFAKVMPGELPKLQGALLPLLSHSRAPVRKRAVTSIGALAAAVTDEQFQVLVQHTLQSMASSVSRTSIQTLAVICREAPGRFAPYVDTALPLVMTSVSIDDDELREAIFQALDVFTVKCPQAMTSSLEQVVALSLEYLVYDPNYNYDDGEDDEMEMSDDEDDEDEEDEYSDDDDMSWKVRRASSKCIASLVESHLEHTPQFHQLVAPILIERFKEREETVCLSIMSTFVTLLTTTRTFCEVHTGASAKLSQSFNAEVEAIMGAIKAKLTNKKQLKTRQIGLNVLQEMSRTYPGAFNTYIDKLLPSIEFCLSDHQSSSNVKIDALSLLQEILKTHDAVTFLPFIPQLVEVVIAALKNPFYKISTEALGVASCLVDVVCPKDDMATVDPSLTPSIKKLFECTKSLMQATDTDQEVKEQAILCTGQMIASLADEFESLQETLQMLLSRLQNEITRIPAARAITMIVSSPLKIDYSNVLSPTIEALASFLRKSNRSLRLVALTTLSAIMNAHAPSIDAQLLENTIAELPPLITAGDLQATQLSLALLTSIIGYRGAIAPKLMSDVPVIPAVLNVVLSPVLHGAARDAVVKFFQMLVRIETPGMGFGNILQMLLDLVYGGQNPAPIPKQAYVTLAKCIAAITSFDTSHASELSSKLLADIAEPTSSDSVRLLAYLTIGELGKMCDLSANQQLLPTIVTGFDSSEEEIKSAASFALGNVSLGNLALFLPVVLTEVRTQPTRQYLLLHSLKEIINCRAEDQAALAQYMEDIWALLFEHCETKEEGTRNVAAECLGKLTLHNPGKLVPALQEKLKSESQYVRSTVITAIRFTLSEQQNSVDGFIKPVLADFFAAISDKSIVVRRAAMIAFNSAAHNKPNLVRDLIPGLLDSLFAQTMVDKSLVHQVEMGPFKHTVDDGLDARKSAFECMCTLLSTCSPQLDVAQLLDIILSGLGDHADIQMLTYHMLVGVASQYPHFVLRRMDDLAAALEKTITTKLKQNAVKQEIEKSEELKKSALRAVVALQQVPSADKSPRLNALLDIIQNVPSLRERFQTMKKAKDADGIVPMDSEA